MMLLLLLLLLLLMLLLLLLLLLLVALVLSLLSSLCSGFRRFSFFFTFIDRLDDSDSDGLSHISHSETSEGSVIGKSFHTHWFRGDQVDDGCVSALHHLWVVFKDFSATSVDFLFEFSEFASDVSCVAIQYWLVSCSDLPWVVQDDD